MDETIQSAIRLLKQERLRDSFRRIHALKNTPRAASVSRVDVELPDGTVVHHTECNGVEHAIREGSGSQFEPALVDILLANLDTFNALRKQFPDEADEATPPDKKFTPSH